MGLLCVRIPSVDGPDLNRRELLAGAAAAAGLAWTAEAAGRGRAWSRTLDFATLENGTGWPGWACAGVANVRREGGRGLLEAGSDVFPCDPRPVAFAVDRRFRDGEVHAEVISGGAGAGVVVRRSGPQAYYAAIYDSEQSALVVLRRTPNGIQELGRSSALPPLGQYELSLRADGRSPTRLRARLAGGVLPVEVNATDATDSLQRPGDPGVLATARTLFPSEGPSAFPALGNLHLLPYGVQEGQVVIDSAVGQALMEQIRQRSTVTLASIKISGSGSPTPTVPSVIAASAGRPLARGAALRVSTDLPARVEIEISPRADFRDSRILPATRQGEFGGAFAKVNDLPEGTRVHWRAHVSRRGKHAAGPPRSFRVPPAAGGGRSARIAIGSCASQFGPAFERLMDREPDLFVWQGDLNYPDTLGPLAQSVPGYAGIWRDFLANPVLAPLFERSMFAVQRDDHDYGIQDANSQNLVARGLKPWRALMERRHFYRFGFGSAEFWVLDQRRFKTDPAAADTTAKTLLGQRQRQWLLRTLKASRSPFKVICSPCTLAPVAANQRDGSWAAGFEAERDLLLRHIRKRVTGRTIFVTGDTHWSMVYDQDGLFEARPCPLGIPTPNDITLTNPQAAEQARGLPGVRYADDDRGHFALLDLSRRSGRHHLRLRLIRDDGTAGFETSFAE